jgi:hypothetical protein
MPVDNLEFKLTGQGDFAADMKSFLGMMTGDMEGGMGTFFESMADMLRGMDAEMTMSLALPEALSMLLPETELPERVTMDFRMADGVAYLNLEEIAAFDPNGSIPAGWLGIDLAELYGEIMPQQFDGMGANGFDMTAMIKSFMEPENAARFMTIERLVDTESMGQSLAVFHTRLDYQNMLDIPAFRDMLEAQIAASTESDAEVEEALAMLDEVYQGLTFDITQAIGLDDHLVHRTDWTFDWDMSFIPDLDTEVAPHFTATMTVETTAFNVDFDVNVPEEAILLPLGTMLLPE